MTGGIRISSELELPLDFVTQACAILAKRRVGKSYTARRIVEQLLRAGQQVVILDPKGDWWGIRSAADGKGPGLPVTIFGGEHGDVALAVESGPVLAKLAAEERVSMVVDLSSFRKHEVATFAAAFLEDLAHRVGISHESGTFSTYLGNLTSNGLADRRGREIFASSSLFLRGRR